MMTAAPELAPNSCCAASPPEPWHTGMAPNQQPTRFMQPTEMDTARVDAACGEGNENEAAGPRQLATPAAALGSRVRGGQRVTHSVQSMRLELLRC
jgi:hypothetical protein